MIDPLVFICDHIITFPNHKALWHYTFDTLESLQLSCVYGDQFTSYFMFLCCNLTMKWSKEMLKKIPPPIVWDKNNTKMKRMIDFGIVHIIDFIIFFIGEIIMKLVIAKGTNIWYLMPFKIFVSSICDLWYQNKLM